MSRPSHRNAIDAKCRDCGGQEGGERRWRLHVSACPVTDCPLWTCRPLATRNVPDWLACRRVDALPAGFATMTTEAVIASLRADPALLSPVTGSMGAARGIGAPDSGEADHG